MATARSRDSNEICERKHARKIILHVRQSTLSFCKRHTLNIQTEK
jgi:hypothetical protein